jgi:membrane-associated phospholipid phosphatase
MSSQTSTENSANTQLWWQDRVLPVLRLVLRQSINRPRPSPPFVQVRQKPHGKSFPSGHVISAVNFWGWLFIVGMRLLKGKPIWLRAMLGIPLLITLLVGPSRIYLGDHWASDVLGGYLFGSGWLGLSLRLYQALKKKGVLSS